MPSPGGNSALMMDMAMTNELHLTRRLGRLTLAIGLIAGRCERACAGRAAAGRGPGGHVLRTAHGSAGRGGRARGGGALVAPPGPQPRRDQPLSRGRPGAERRSRWRRDADLYERRRRDRRPHRDAPGHRPDEPALRAPDRMERPGEQPGSAVRRRHGPRRDRPRPGVARRRRARHPHRRGRAHLRRHRPRRLGRRLQPLCRTDALDPCRAAGDQRRLPLRLRQGRTTIAPASGSTRISTAPPPTA